MTNPSMVLLDEPSMGLAPQIVEEVFNIVKDLNTKEKVTFLLAEQNTNMALKYSDYGYIMESGRVVMDGAASRPGQQRRREGVLPGRGRRRAQELQGRQELQAPQALAGLSMPPVALRAFPLRGTHPVAWQSQFHGCAGDRQRRAFQGSALSRFSNLVEFHS
jgi:ABC-type multidrug transport system ATPase subunit